MSNEKLDQGVSPSSGTEPFFVRNNQANMPAPLPKNEENPLFGKNPSNSPNKKMQGIMSSK